ncbi:hypothetical protein THAOC_10006 [Thalassiosira oceanica]|uniref:Uncharacterized protein n=1 Tax=Thalassiosira oceanica TaxID=159749 RepID=K0T664_THAOC|nr:hypothetical protein THAOC_10006 [Thalassiosira oceanica]|eukprot:EJK68786.1 hypothetical protein THAOC_10006 [Thalassiosira oceanica]
MTSSTTTALILTATLPLQAALAFSSWSLGADGSRGLPPSAHTSQPSRPSPSRLSYKASTVADPHGTVAPLPGDPIPEVDLASLPESHYDPDDHLPNQPWRRGDTAGCHDPISAPWRLKAEDVIDHAVNRVGGKVVDVTWYMAKCVISIDQASLVDVVPYVHGPPVQIEYPEATDFTGHVFEDPESGTEDEMFTEEDELLDYEQYDEDTEYEIMVANMPQEEDEDTGEPLPPREPRDRSVRMRELQEEWESRWEDEPELLKPSIDPNRKSKDPFHEVDTKALAVVARAINEALSEDEVEDKLEILSRHDIILTSPLENPCVLDSQREFDDARDLDVFVETRDPWGSNRVLFGKLVDRNAMDVIINQDNSGRMVTIPNCMIHQVLLPSGLAVVSENFKQKMAEEYPEYYEQAEVEEEEVFE